MRSELIDNGLESFLTNDSLLISYPFLMKYSYEISQLQEEMLKCSFWIYFSPLCEMFRLVVYFQIFRRLMKGKFDAYALWPLAKKFQNWIVDRSTARDFTVSQLQAEMLKCSFWNYFSPLCEMMMLNTVWWSSLILQYHQLPSILTSFHFFCWEKLTFFRISTKKLNNYQS